MIKTHYMFKILMMTGAVLVAQPVGAFQALDNVQSSALSVQVADDHIAGAQNFVDGMTKRGLGFLSNADLSDAQRKVEFKKLLQDSFDMKTIARFALGRYWRSASDAEKKEYVSLFQKMVVDVYAQRFSEYNGQTLTVGDARGEGQNDAIVTSKISSPGSSDVTVDWRVRYKDGRYKVIDVIVEGVSMGLTQRSDFSSVIQRGGGQVSALLEHLRNS